MVGTDDALLHTIGVMAKQHIFQCKHSGHRPSINQFVNSVKNVKKMEMYSGNQQMFEWDSFTDEYL